MNKMVMMKKATRLQTALQLSRSKEQPSLGSPINPFSLRSSPFPYRRAHTPKSSASRLKSSRSSQEQSLQAKRSQRVKIARRFQWAEATFHSKVQK